MEGACVTAGWGALVGAAGFWVAAGGAWVTMLGAWVAAGGAWVTAGGCWVVLSAQSGAGVGRLVDVPPWQGFWVAQGMDCR